VLGTQDGRRVDLLTAYELTVDPAATGDKGRFNAEVFKERTDLYAEVFPKMEVVGWYTAGASAHLATHKQLTTLSGNEAPFALLMAETTSQPEDLPLQVLELVTKIDGDSAVEKFEVMPFSVESTESERIATEHVTRSATTQSAGGYSSSYVQNLGSLNSAVGMLLKRLEGLHAYALEVQAGTKPWNHQAVREMRALLDALEALPPQELRKAQLAEHNDTLLAVYMATMTKTSAHLSDLLQSFSQIHERKARRGFPF